jgi:hypothetical protein
VRRFSVTLRFTPLNGPGDAWCLTNVYGPTSHADKDDFLQELRDVRANHGCFCGDFNMSF